MEHHLKKSDGTGLLISHFTGLCMNATLSEWLGKRNLELNYHPTSIISKALISFVERDFVI